MHRKELSDAEKQREGEIGMEVCNVKYCPLYSSEYDNTCCLDGCEDDSVKVKTCSLYKSQKEQADKIQALEAENKALKEEIANLRGIEKSQIHTIACLEEKLDVAEEAFEYVEEELIANRRIELVRAYQRTQEALSTLRGEEETNG